MKINIENKFKVIQNWTLRVEIFFILFYKCTCNLILLMSSILCEE